jgi:hypothetical protein
MTCGTRDGGLVAARRVRGGARSGTERSPDNKPKEVEQQIRRVGGHDLSEIDFLTGTVFVWDSDGASDVDRLGASRKHLNIVVVQAFVSAVSR